MTIFRRAYLQEHGFRRLGREEDLLRSECERRGIPVEYYTMKKILRRQLPLGPETFIAGDLDAMQGAMRQLGIPVPAPLDYPECLTPCVRRFVWRTTLGEIERRFHECDYSPVFIKPADRGKNFIGRVFASLEDFRVIGQVSRRQAVWCGTPVKWLVEYRVYMVRGHIAGIARYAGAEGTVLDDDVLSATLKAYESSGHAPAGYVLDMGVLSTGETALVEVNDGFSVGAYDKISAENYTDLLMARWAELLQQRGQAPRLRA
jgi:hypothetical protein